MLNYLLTKVRTKKVGRMIENTAVKKLSNITLSSNGRTTGFGPVNGGSNPSGVTKDNGLSYQCDVDNHGRTKEFTTLC